jgi:hypothetical protein
MSTNLPTGGFPLKGGDCHWPTWGFW